MIKLDVNLQENKNNQEFKRTLATIEEEAGFVLFVRIMKLLNAER